MFDGPKADFKMFADGSNFFLNLKSGDDLPERKSATPVVPTCASTLLGHELEPIDSVKVTPVLQVTLRLARSPYSRRKKATPASKRSRFERFRCGHLFTLAPTPATCAHVFPSELIPSAVVSIHNNAHADKKKPDEMRTNNAKCVRTRDETKPHQMGTTQADQCDRHCSVCASLRIAQTS